MIVKMYENNQYIKKAANAWIPPSVR